VQGTVSPDEFFIFKPTLVPGKNPIIQKKCGAKESMLIYEAENGTTTTRNMPVAEEKRTEYVLSDHEIITLAKWALAIEKHYKMPMDIEWAKDGESGELFIIQARPETVHSRTKERVIHEYRLLKKGNTLATGLAVGSKIATGRARVLKSVADAMTLEKGDVVVTGVTSPDWDPLLKKVAAIVTDRGGRTSHASIVARELGVPAVVGTLNATEKISDGEMITVSCAEGKTGYVYEGALPVEQSDINVGDVKMPEATDAMLIIADPDKAFQLSFYPNCGVGLLRMEFIIANWIGVHPMALVKFEEIKDPAVKQSLTKLTTGYVSPKAYFVERLAQGIATIAAAFYPKDVIVRMSDFKTNEYANLVGGKQFEPVEENPMIGFRGASRYYNDSYKEGFGLECEAITIVRQEMGLTNVKVMIPFCRTVEEGKRVIKVMKEFGLNRLADQSLEIYVMAEIPSNVLQAAEFAEIFDGFSIGSNDLTQLTLGIDRDSSLVADLFDENNVSAKRIVAMMIDGAKRAGSKIGFCGQAPSDDPSYAGFLVELGIDSISFNPDAFLKGIENITHHQSRSTVS
jgi:pyruvate,water dikinase